MRQGKFIVFYGINNLGKTTQIKLLIERLRMYEIDAEYLKYSIYDLEPSGVMIDEYLRKGNPYHFSPREFQMCHVLNRTQYEPILKQKLASGKWVIAEDYKWTGVAWGVGAGVDKDFLLRLNSHLLDEDFAILFDGERFVSGIEVNHKHEQNNTLLTKVRTIHLEFAKLFGWPIIKANESVEKVHEKVWQFVVEKFRLVV